jgi:hypothetical protein
MEVKSGNASAFTDGLPNPADRLDSASVVAGEYIVVG